MTLSLLFVVFMVVIGVIAQVLPADFIAMLLPVIVWLATALVNWIKAKLTGAGFGGAFLLTIIVPGLSLLGAWIDTQLLVPDVGFWYLFAYGLLGTFVNEIIKQWSQTLTKTQTPVKSNLIG